jgi:hypothetical protein
VKLQPESLGALPKGQKFRLGEIHNIFPLPQSSRLASTMLPACPLLICAAPRITRPAASRRNGEVEGAGWDHRSCLPRKHLLTPGARRPSSSPRSGLGFRYTEETTRMEQSAGLRKIAQLDCVSGGQVPWMGNSPTSAICTRAWAPALPRRVILLPPHRRPGPCRSGLSFAQGAGFERPYTGEPRTWHARSPQGPTSVAKGS